MKRLKLILQSKLFLYLTLLFLVSYVLLFTKVIRYESKYLESDTKITGKIQDYNIDGDKLSMLIYGKEKIKVTYYLKSEQEKNELSNILAYGKEIELTGSYNELSNNTVPNTFNYKKYLYNKRIYRQMIASTITVKNQENILYKMKNNLVKRINTISTKAYLHAFILGDNSYINDDTFSSYQANGVTHLFAISGMHVGIFIMLLEKLLHKVKIKDLVIILFLAFYMFIVGFTASVVRASLLYVLLKVNKRLNLNLDTKRILYLLFILLIIINPFIVYDLGFQYSFTTSFGLILFSNKIRGNYLKRTFLVSVIAFFFSLPITIYNFYEFNLLTILNNIIIVPLVSILVFPFTLITFIFPFLSPVLVYLIKILEFISIFLAKFKILIVIPKVGIIFIVIYYLLIYFIYKNNFKYGIMLIILTLGMKLKPYLNSHDEVYFLDVGQGDAAIFISSHARDVIMIDTGGKITYPKEEWQKPSSEFDFSETLATFLKSKGLNTLHYLIITHGDYDHMGEAIKLVDKVRIKQVIFNNGPYNTLEQKFIKILDNKKIKYYQGMKELQVYKYKFYFLNTKIYDNENDNSNVIYTNINGTKLLFMGDAGVDTERNILKEYNLKNIDILKVGHHGSDTSTSKEFIDAITPRVAILSVGKNNRYNHPKESVLTTLHDSLIYRTDLNGSVQINFLKNRYVLKTCPP